VSQQGPIVVVGEGWELALPSRWTKKAGRTPRETYFETNDKSKGLYLTVYDVRTGTSADQSISEIQNAQTQAFARMQNHNWEVVQLKRGNEGDDPSLIFDSLERSKRYRICSKIISNGAATISASFHDYACASYMMSCRVSTPLLNSIRITNPAPASDQDVRPNEIDVRLAVAYLKALDKSGVPGLHLEGPHRLVGSAFSDDAIVTYVVDTGSNYTFVQKRHLDSQRITANQLHEMALNNLAELAQTKSMRVESYGRIFAVFMGGDFEASLVLIDSLWDGPFRKYVSGDYAVAIPARDILSFCDVSDSKGIQELYEVIGRTAEKGDHLLANSIHVRKGTTWVSRKQ
jgi:hypothetical protein